GPGPEGAARGDVEGGEDQRRDPDAPGVEHRPAEEHLLADRRGEGDQHEVAEAGAAEEALEFAVELGEPALAALEGPEEADHREPEDDADERGPEQRRRADLRVQAPDVVALLGGRVPEEADQEDDRIEG